MSKKLNHLRNEIDLIDQKFILLLKKRQDLLKKIAQEKALNDVDIYQPSRESDMRERNNRWADKYDLDPEFLQRIFSVITTESKQFQEKKLYLIDDPVEYLKSTKFIYKEKKLPLALPVLEIFKRLYRVCDRAFLLESLGNDPNLARHSVIGFSPRFIIQAQNGSLFVNKTKINTQHPYEYLKKLAPKSIRSRKGFSGGLVGYFSYPALQYFENISLLLRTSEFPDFEFGFFEDGLIFNKKESSLSYFYLREDRSEQILDSLNLPSYNSHLRAKITSISPSKKNFLLSISQAKDEIKKGNSFQIVLSRRYNLKFLGGNPLFFYERLRELDPSTHMFYLKFGDRELIGSSPELLLWLENGFISNFPIAGTRGRGQSAVEDDLMISDLLKDEKEKAEHLMLVDLGRNDLGRISAFGSVKVKQLMEIKKFSHVQHMVSELTGKLLPKYDMFDALRAFFPMGTVSGAPKLETIDIIDRLESFSRGPYAGCVGYFSLNGDANFALMIRSMFKSGSTGFIQAGAGIVHYSDLEKEYQETEKKMKGLLRALDIKVSF